MEPWRIEFAAGKAIEHYRAAFHCSRENGFMFSSSQLMLASFSAELSMKALIYSSGSIVKGHQLKKLLDQLPLQYKREIETELKEEWPDYVDFLNDANNAFVDWRYIFEVRESKTVNSKFVMRLAEVCCVIVKRELNIDEYIVVNGVRQVHLLPSVND